MAKDDKTQVRARVAHLGGSSTGAIAGDAPFSILSLAAASYGARPSDDATVPTGFDPIAVALFEAIVEGAYLVASADGVFDDDERMTFEKVVLAACGGAVAPRQVSALVADLERQLQEDGLECRIEMVGRQVHREHHSLEVLRIAALLATASNDVSGVERQVLLKLAIALKLGANDLEGALADVTRALAVV
jgi:tellurite resistance protein